MKWFNVSAVFKEISKIRWPEKKELLKNSVAVLVFIGLFSAFFYLCTLVISSLLKIAGVL